MECENVANSRHHSLCILHAFGGAKLSNSSCHKNEQYEINVTKSATARRIQTLSQQGEHLLYEITPLRQTALLGVWRHYVRKTKKQQKYHLLCAKIGTSDTAKVRLQLND